MSEIEEDNVDSKLKGQHMMALLFSVGAGILGVLATGGGLEALKQYFYEEQPEIIISMPPNAPEKIKVPPKQTVVEPVEEIEELLSNPDSDVVIDLPEPIEDIPPEIVEVADVLVEGDPIGDVNPSDGVEAPYAGLPGIVSKRCSREDRIQRIAELGGKPESEDSVEAALQWLAENQQEDGSWSKSSDMQKVSLTSLSVLAFLGRCETPVSSSTIYRNAVRNGLDFLVSKALEYDGDIVNNGDKVHESAYVQAVMAYALCESYTFCNEIGYTGIEGLEEAVSKSILAIIEGQNDNGGWVYEYGALQGKNSSKESDSSIVGWSMQALKAAKFTGLEWEGHKEAISGGKKVLLKHQKPDGSFGYRLNQPQNRKSLGLTMAGTLVFQQNIDSSKDEEKDELQAGIDKGIEFFMENVSDLNYKAGGFDASLYNHYYATQVLVNKGGSDWEKYRDLYLKPTLENQHADGNFKIPKNPLATGEYKAGKDGMVYTTTLSVLMLEVFYRFLPTTQTIVVSSVN